MQRKSTRNTIRTLATGTVLGTALLFTGTASADGDRRHRIDHDERAQLATADLILRAVIGNAQPVHYRGHPHRYRGHPHRYRGHPHRFKRPGYYRQGRFYSYPRYRARPLIRHHRLHKRWDRYDDRRHRRDDRWEDRKGRRDDRRDGRRRAH